MKGSAILCLILFVLLLLIPVMSVGASVPGEEPPTPQFEEPSGESSVQEESEAPASEQEDSTERKDQPAEESSFRILDTATGEVLTAVSYTHLDVYKRQSEGCR